LCFIGVTMDFNFYIFRIFNNTEIEQIRNTTMRDVIASVTSLSNDVMQKNVFNADGKICFV